jgi:hypothetical protein
MQQRLHLIIHERRILNTACDLDDKLPAVAEP